MGKATAPKDDPIIEFSVRVIEGREVKFESSIAHPLSLSDDAKKLAVDGWLELMSGGLKIGRAMCEGGKDG